MGGRQIIDLLTVRATGKFSTIDDFNEKNCKPLLSAVYYAKSLGIAFWINIFVTSSHLDASLFLAYWLIVSTLCTRPLLGSWPEGRPVLISKQAA